MIANRRWASLRWWPAPFALVIAGACMQPLRRAAPPPTTATPAASLTPSTAPELLAFGAAAGSPREGVLRLRAVGCADVSTATGFYVEGLGVITNRHVVDGAGRIDAETWDGLTVLTGRAVAAEAPQGGDIAVIPVSETNGDGRSASLQGLRLQAIPPEVGSVVRVLGFPRGRQYEDHLGTIVGRSDDGAGNSVLVLDVAAEPGNSGSPVIDDAGDVVGVVYARRTEGGHILAVPAARLSRVATDLTNRPTPAPAESCPGGPPPAH